MSIFPTPNPIVYVPWENRVLLIGEDPRTFVVPPEKLRVSSVPEEVRTFVVPPEDRRDGPSCPIPFDGLIALYAFDEGSGDTVFDGSGHAYHLPFPATFKPTWVTGGLKFDWAVTNPLVYTHGSDIHPGGDFSMIMCGNLRRPSMHSGYLTLAQSMIWFGLGGYDPARFDWEVGPTDAYVVDSGWLGTDRMWSITQAGTKAKLYIGIIEIGLASGIDRATLPFNRIVLGDGFWNTKWNDMTIYHLLLYSRVLTPTEISNIYTALKALLAGRGITLP